MGLTNAMSGPKSVRSARARAPLFVFGGRGWLAEVQGPGGPFKTWISPELNSLHWEESIWNGLHQKPCRIWSSQLARKWFSPVSYITAETQIDIYHEVKSTTGVFAKLYCWSCSSKAATERHLCRVLRLQTSRYQPSISHADIPKDS